MLFLVNVICPASIANCTIPDVTGTVNTGGHNEAGPRARSNYGRKCRKRGSVREDLHGVISHPVITRLTNDDTYRPSHRSNNVQSDTQKPGVSNYRRNFLGSEIPLEKPSAESLEFVQPFTHAD